MPCCPMWPDPRTESPSAPSRSKPCTSVGPILEGIGLNITAWSYSGALGVSLLACPVSVPLPWLIIDALHDALDELRTAVVNRD
jgi:diacylglycerol O-acyltransferase